MLHTFKDYVTLIDFLARPGPNVPNIPLERRSYRSSSGTMNMNYNMQKLIGQVTVVKSYYLVIKTSKTRCVMYQNSKTYIVPLV